MKNLFKRNFSQKKRELEELTVEEPLLETTLPEDALSKHVVDGVTPPSHRKEGWGHDRWLTTILMMGVVVVIGLLLLGRQQPASTPLAALQQIRQALMTGDVERLQQYVDMDRVAINVVDQYYVSPDLNPADLPASLRESLPKDASAMVKPGLTEMFKEDALAAIKGQREGDTKTLFHRVWAEISDGKPVKVVGIENTIADENVAHVDVLIQRQGDENPATLSLRLEREKENAWRVSAVQNVESTIAALDEASLQGENLREEMHVAESAPAPKGEKSIDKEHPADIQETAKVAAPTWLPFKDVLSELQRISDTKKQVFVTAMPAQVVTLRGAEKKVVGEGAAKGLLLTLKLTGEMTKDITLLKGHVVFRDSIGRTLKTFEVTDTIGVGAGQNVEKTWKLPLQENVRRDRQIARVPLQAMDVVLVPTHIELADGRIFKKKG